MAIAVAMGIIIIVTEHAQHICLANNNKVHLGIDACVLSDSFVLVQNEIGSNSEQVDMVSMCELVDGIRWHKMHEEHSIA